MVVSMASRMVVLRAVRTAESMVFPTVALMVAPMAAPMAD